MLGEVAEKRGKEIAGYIERGGSNMVRFPFEEGLSGVVLFVAGKDTSPPSLKHTLHSVALMGVGGESAVVRSGGELVDEKEHLISGAVIVGERKGRDILHTPESPVQQRILNEGEQIVIPPDTAYMVRPINGGTSAVLALKFRDRQSYL